MRDHDLIHVWKSNHNANVVNGRYVEWRYTSAWLGANDHVAGFQ
jgi:hypothetical protein